MIETIGNGWMWTGFVAFIGMMVAIDMLLLGRQGAHRVSAREAGVWSLVWVGAGAGLQRRPVVVAGRAARAGDRQPAGARIPDRLSGREGAGGRQHLRVCVDLRLLRRAARVPAAGAAVRRAGCDRDARGDDPGRRAADRALSLGAVPVRRVAGGHRRQDAAVRRPRAGSGEKPGAALAARAPAGHRRLSRRPLHRATGRRACGSRPCSWCW